MGGQGGSTQGAGTANGVGLPQDQSVGMGLRAQEIGVEMANTLSQIKLNESQANKNEAEADKIKGVDTEAQQATIDNLIAQTSNEKIKRGLILGQIRVADAEEELKRNTADWTNNFRITCTAARITFKQLLNLKGSTYSINSCRRSSGQISIQSARRIDRKSVV